jgi:hypothetical protein
MNRSFIVLRALSLAEKFVLRRKVVEPAAAATAPIHAPAEDAGDRVQDARARDTLGVA